WPQSPEGSAVRIKGMIMIMQRCLLVALAMSAYIPPASAQAPKAPMGATSRLSGASRLKYDLAGRPAEAEREGQELAGSQPSPFLGRAYPASAVDEVAREAAYEAYKAIRGRLGLRHINAGWAD